ncbi:MAG: hypothetical protein ACRDFA_12670 [bacterium]
MPEVVNTDVGRNGLSANRDIIYLCHEQQSGRGAPLWWVGIESFDLNLLRVLDALLVAHG